MIAVAATIVVATAVGVLLERRFGDAARRATQRGLTGALYGVFPFVIFFNIARLEITADVGGGLALAYVTLAIVGVVAWLLATRVLRLAAPTAGSTIVGAIQVNSGYVGLPLTVALLGADELRQAVAYDTIVSGPVLLLGCFGVGAAFGTRAGETARERLRAFFTRNPPLLGFALGLLAPDALAPDVLVDASQVAIIALLPLGFVALGVFLEAESEEGAFAFPPPVTVPVALVLALRLLVAPAVLYLLARPLIDLPDPYLLLAAMPCGVNSLIVAHIYGLDVRLTSSVIAWSTAIVVTAALAVELVA